jgi:hypothetical protein
VCGGNFGLWGSGRICEKVRCVVWLETWTLPLSASSASAVAVRVWEFLKVGTYETSSY